MIDKIPLPVITIDGPGGTGKGTLALLVTRWLGWNLLDSGALYRALALFAVEEKISVSEQKKLIDIACSMNIRFHDNGANNLVFLNGRDITDSIRTEECGTFASKLAALGPIRTTLLGRQRAFLRPPGLVADGRDMGTTVFPEANLKIYLTASIEQRAERRHKQLKEKGITARLARLSEDIKSRDERDSLRGESPMKPASEAKVVDTTELSIEGAEAVVKRLIVKQFGNLLDEIRDTRI